VTRNSLFRSAYELFYTPLPPMKKRAAKTIIDVGVDRIGTALGSGVLLVIARVTADGDLRAQTRIVAFRACSR
jgi:ATP/ADP translocase